VAVLEMVNVVRVCWNVFF